MGQKNNFRSFICSESFTNPANFVKIVLVDVEIIGLTEIATNIFEQQYSICRPRVHFVQSGWANKCDINVSYSIYFIFYTCG